MENDYNTSKSVLEKLRTGLDLESANMDRDIEADFQTLFNTEQEKVVHTWSGGDHKVSKYKV